MVLSSPAIHVISTGANQSNVLAVSVYATVNFGMKITVTVCLIIEMGLIVCTCYPQGFPRVPLKAAFWLSAS